MWRAALTSTPATQVPPAEADAPVAVQIGDRNDGSDFTLLEELTAKGTHLEELPASTEDRAQGRHGDVRAKRGGGRCPRTVRAKTPLVRKVTRPPCG